MGDVNALGAAMAMMDWDQQTYMPRGGAEARANHLECLSKMHHDIFIADETRKALEGAKAEASSEDDVALLRVIGRDLDLATKLPSELVARKTKLSAIAHEEWVRARTQDDFEGFAPTLEQMFEIVKEEAHHLGFTDHIYDAVTDQYEEGATAADWKKMFEAIKGPQVELVKAIQATGPVDDSRLYGEWDRQKQSQFTEMIVSKIGFDFNRGRQDTAPHPFCTGWSVGDIRLTTRYKPYLGSAIFGSLHEAGHGMYEQGSPATWDLTSLAGGVSLGLHESQSRTWENIGIAFLGRVAFGKDAMGHGDIKMMRGVGALIGGVLTAFSVGIAVVAGLVFGLLFMAIAARKSKAAQSEGDEETGTIEEEDYKPESIKDLLILGISYLFCIDILAIWFPQVYTKFGYPVEDFSVEDDEWEPSLSTIPFGPYLAIGALVCILFKTDLLDKWTEYLRTMQGPAFLP